MTLTQHIKQARGVYLWIATTEHDGKYVAVPPPFMLQLVEHDFEGQIDYTLDHDTNEIYFH